MFRAGPIRLKDVEATGPWPPPQVGAVRRHRRGERFVQDRRDQARRYARADRFSTKLLKQTPARPAMRYRPLKLDTMASEYARQQAKPGSAAKEARVAERPSCLGRSDCRRGRTCGDRRARPGPGRRQDRPPAVLPGLRRLPPEPAGPDQEYEWRVARQLP